MRSTLSLPFVIVVVLAFGAWFFFKPDPHGNALRARALATRGLAEHLARTHPGKRALIVANPFIQQGATARAIVATEAAGIRGLREGFGSNVTVAAVALPDLRPEARDNPRALLAGTETTTPLSYLVAPGAFDQLARQHPDCELIVSLIGLPADLSRCEVWHNPGPPQFALLLPDLRMVGDAAAVESALKSGKLAALVLLKPGAPGDDVAPGKDFSTEFEKRFLLVNDENAPQILRAYPGLF